ncbi:hypothetical protein IT411_01255 [Candidatus Peregrinibacteria bacterium]|nr:hypothetical protein [Candidatus Peregrinibacteria bacterium]
MAKNTEITTDVEALPVLNKSISPIWVETFGDLATDTKTQAFLSKIGEIPEHPSSLDWQGIHVNLLLDENSSARTAAVMSLGNWLMADFTDPQEFLSRWEYVKEVLIALPRGHLFDPGPVNRMKEELGVDTGMVGAIKKKVRKSVSLLKGIVTEKNDSLNTSLLVHRLLQEVVDMQIGKLNYLYFDPVIHQFDMEAIVERAYVLYRAGVFDRHFELCVSTEWGEEFNMDVNQLSEYFDDVPHDFDQIKRRVYDPRPELRDTVEGIFRRGFRKYTEKYLDMLPKTSYRG